MNHTHKYQKITAFSTKREILKCMLPDCRHYEIEPILCLGRASLCADCETPIILTNKHIKYEKKFRCDSCRKKIGENRRKIKELTQ